MELMSLYLFTMLGGAAVGLYVFEACFSKKRTGERPWLIAAVVVILFACGLIAATTHINSIPRALGSLSAGTTNFSSGMVHEVLAAGVFLVLAAIDLIIGLAKKESPFGLRAVTAVVGLACIILMGMAYIDSYNVEVWCNAPATVITFVAGALAMGLALYAALAYASYADKPLMTASIAVNVALALGLVLEIAAFSACGESIAAQIVGLVIAPAASIVCVLRASKFEDQKKLAWIVLALAIVGVAIARYAFYAVCAVA